MLHFMAHIDPFHIKRRSKINPIRIIYTLLARSLEWESIIRFDHYQLPMLVDPAAQEYFDYQQEYTAVSPKQMGLLVHALSSLSVDPQLPVVEVGCYRGSTTRALAINSDRKVIAVDPFIGYGGSGEDYTFFKKQTLCQKNVVHVRQTSGEAALGWKHGPIAMVFIDAVHDYVNTTFDISVWGNLLIEDGILALHDTDNKLFAGTRKAAWLAATQFTLIGHVHDCVLLRKTHVQRTMP